MIAEDTKVLKSLSKRPMCGKPLNDRELNKAGSWRRRFPPRVLSNGDCGFRDAAKSVPGAFQK